MTKMMSAGECKSAMAGAQVPDHIVQMAETKGVPLASLWDWISKLIPLVAGNLPALWAIIEQIIHVWPTPGPGPSPVVPGKIT